MKKLVYTEELINKCRKLPRVTTKNIKFIAWDEFDPKTGHNTYYSKYDYDNDWYNFQKLFYDLELNDKHYKKNYQKISKKFKTDSLNLDNLNIDKILTVITYYIEMENFKQGSIAKALEKGIFTQCIDKIKSIIEEHDKELR